MYQCNIISYRNNGENMSVVHNFAVILLMNVLAEHSLCNSGMQNDFFILVYWDACFNFYVENIFFIVKNLYHFFFFSKRILGTLHWPNQI